MPEPDLGHEQAMREGTLAVWCVDQWRSQGRGTFSSQHVRACVPGFVAFYEGLLGGAPTGFLRAFPGWPNRWEKDALLLSLPFAPMEGAFRHMSITFSAGSFQGQERKDALQEVQKCAKQAARAAIKTLVEAL